VCSDHWSSHHCNWARRAIWTPGVCDGCVGAVVIGNALHWMDEAEHVVDVDWVVGHLSSAMNAAHWSAAGAD